MSLLARVGRAGVPRLPVMTRNIGCSSSDDWIESPLISLLGKGGCLEWRGKKRGAVSKDH